MSAMRQISGVRAACWSRLMRVGRPPVLCNMKAMKKLARHLSVSHDDALIQPLLTIASTYRTPRGSATMQGIRRVKSMLRRLREFVSDAHLHQSLGLCADDVGSACAGIQCLEHLISQQAQTSLSSPTDMEILHAILEAWCRERRRATCQIAAIQPTILLRWVDQLTSDASTAQQYGDAVSLKHSRESYRYLMDGDMANVEFVELLFQRTLHSFDPNISPTVDDFHRVMHANIVNGRVQKAESHFQSLLQLHRSNLEAESVYLPTSRTYNMLIAGYAKAERPHDADRILQQLLDDGIVQEAAPPAYCFETCLNAWTSSRHKSAGHRAESLVLQMHRLGVSVTPQSFVKVIAAWTQSRRVNGPERAKAVLRLLLSVLREEGDEESQTKDNGSIAGSWTDAKLGYGKVVLKAYLHVIRAFALTATRDPTAPDQCEALFKELLSSQHVATTQSTSGSNGSSRSSLRKICSMVCLAWARSKRRDAVENVERLLHQLEKDFAMPVDRFSCNVLLEAHAKQGDGRGAIRTWNEYFDGAVHAARLEPDIQSVNWVLLALNRSRGQGNLEAEQFWGRVRNRAGIVPDVVTFNALLSLTGKSDKLETARRGEEYLAQLKLSHSKGNAACRPNAVTYAKAIELWENVRSHPEEAIQRVQAHWASMHRQGIMPSEAAYRAYNNVLQRNGEWKIR